ncbi:MAG: VOC family protein, partial [Pseudomonadota bacterium]
MKIDYIELPAQDLEAMKAFYGAAFGWRFVDWGADYVAFSEAGLEGGFRRETEKPPRGGALVILLTDDLDAAERSVREAGGEITAR